MAKNIQAFDGLFRALMARAKRAATLVQDLLLPEVAARIDWSVAPVIRNTLFIKGSLRRGQTDCLLQFTTTEGEALFVFVLLEHKSRPDPFIYQQILEYHAMIWRHFANTPAKARQMPDICPLVIYTGAQDWNISGDLAETIPSRKGQPQPHGLDLRIQLERVGQTAFSRFTDPQVRVSLKAMVTFSKRRVALEVQMEMVSELFRTIPSASDLDAPTKSFILDQSELAPAKVADLAEDARPNIGGMDMATTREQMIAQGKAETLVQLLHLRFGEVPAPVEQQVMQASPDELNALLGQAVKARSLKTIFGGLGGAT